MPDKELPRTAEEIAEFNRRMEYGASPEELLAMQPDKEQSPSVTELRAEAERIVAENIEAWGWGPLDEIDGLSEHKLAVDAVEAGLRARIEALHAERERLREALEVFARCPTHGKHGGRFVIAKAVFEDMCAGNSAPREAYWHKSDFDNARTALNASLKDSPDAP